MLIVVTGSSGFNEVEGIATGDPTALLRVVEQQSPDHVVVLSPQTSAAEAREQAHVVIAARPQVRVAVLPLAHHPLTLTLVAAAVQEQLPPDGDPGDAVLLINQSAARSRSLVWYPRAWGVHEPPPTARQLLASTFRSPGLFREIGPEPALVSAGLGSPVTERSEVYVAGDVPNQLYQHLGVPVRTVPVVLEDGDGWATRSSVAITVLVPAAGGTGGTPCPSCGAHQNGGGCSFCGTRANRAAGAPVLVSASASANATSDVVGG